MAQPVLIPTEMPSPDNTDEDSDMLIMDDHDQTNKGNENGNKQIGNIDKNTSDNLPILENMNTGTSEYCFVPYTDTNESNMDLYYQHISLVSEYINKSQEELRYEDHNHMEEQQQRPIQQYLSNKKGHFFLLKQAITGDKVVPEGTVGCIVERKAIKGRYCAIFMKPYDNAEYTITDIGGQLSFS